jgi:predicted GNAT superfamily acetyltransferase
MESPYRVRLASSRADYDACVELQRTVWRLNDVDVTSALHLITVVHAGGIVQLAETTAGQPVGFAFALAALENGRPHYYSDMVAVLPEHQKHGLGLGLKWAQRAEALARGIDLITWTFEPLRARNAHANLRRLGATGERYLVDFYGTTGGRRSQGRDRVAVRWHLRDERVARLAEGGELSPTVDAPDVPRINEVKWQAGWPVGSDPDLGLQERELLLEIPPEWDVLAQSAPRMAQDWQAKIRSALQGYMERGYVAADFAPTEENGRRRPFYVLRRA